MLSKMDIPWSAGAELGRVKEEEGGLYRVESLHRLGVVSPPLPVFYVAGSVPDGEGGSVGVAMYPPGLEELSAGDKVWFFLTEEGRGLIFAKG